MPSYKYKAFISYRHTEPDMQAAEKLQKLLEAYKPPKNLSNDKEKEKWRIFRDVSELQTSTDLSEDISNAIENSEFLIVICSPRYKESKWCMQELTHFRELHGNTNANIITILVDGEPQDAFPEVLTYKDVKTVNDKGEEVVARVEVEPLAANIKSDTLKESMKKLNTEYLRIAAPMLGCGFNDLYQREKKREARRRRRIFLVVSGVLTVITVISLYSALTISKKNKDINRKNDEINKKNSELQVENAEHLAAESEILYGDNELIPAIRKGLEALPTDGSDKPVIPQAEYAVSKEMDMFAPERIVPQLPLRHETAVEKLSFMGDGKSIVSQDATGIYFWDAESGKLIKKLSSSDSEFASDKKGSSNRLDSHFDLSRDKTGTVFSNFSAPGAYSYETGMVFEMLYTSYRHEVNDDEPGTGGDVFVYNSDYTLWRLNGADGEILWKCGLSDKAYSYIKVMFFGDHIVRLYQGASVFPNGQKVVDNKVYVEVIDAASGEIISNADISALGGNAFNFGLNADILGYSDGQLYAYSEDSDAISRYSLDGGMAKAVGSVDMKTPENEKYNSYKLRFMDGEPVVYASNSVVYNETARVLKYDKGFKKAAWTAELKCRTNDDTRLYLLKAADSGAEMDVLAVVSDYSVWLLDYSNGKVLRTYTFDCKVIDSSYSQWGLLMFTVDNGGEYAISIKSCVGEKSKATGYRIQQLTTSVALCSYSRGKYVTAEDYSDTAYIQYVTGNEYYKQLDFGEKFARYKVVAVSENGRYALVTASEYEGDKPNASDKSVARAYVYDVESNGKTEISALEDYIVQSAVFTGDKLYAAAYKRDAVTYEKKVFVAEADGSSQAVPVDADFTISNTQLSPGGSGVCYVTDDGKDIVRIDTDGKEVSWSEKAGTGDEKTLAEGAVYSVSGTKLALMSENKADGKRQLEVCDLESGSTVALDIDVSAEDGLSVYRLFWQNADTVGAFLSDRTVAFFDAASGKLTSRADLNGTSQEPLSVVPLDGERFAVLCRDSKLYEMNSSGCTGRSLSLGGKDGNGIDYDKDKLSADMLDAFAAPCENCCYVVWDDDQAWLIDLEKFCVRYRINGFAGASSQRREVFTADSWKDIVGYFPVYTTEQLIEAAEKYLALFEE